MDIQGKKIAVLGGGIAGKATMKYALTRKSSITLFDSKKESEYTHDEKIFFKNNNIHVVYNAVYFEGLECFDLVVSSPGIDPKRQDIQKAVEAGVPLYTDVTLFMEIWDGTGPIIGVTGSNGKSTVVTLFDEALRTAGVHVLMGGNIGNSPLDWLRNPKISKDAYIVLELSSYILEYFKPEHVLDIAVVISFSQNHLSRHGTLDEYARVKTLGIKPGKTKVFLGDTTEIERYIKPHINSGVDTRVITKDTAELLLEKISHMTMLGKHNKINCAIVAATLNYCNLLTEDVKKTLYEFPGLAHRIEVIGIHDGVRFINDSKSTSPDATVKALEAATEQADKNKKNIILIAGGIDKGVTYDSWEDLFKSSVKSVILLPGPAREKISQVADRSGVITTITKNQTAKGTMKEAVTIAKSQSKVGDTILLSPGAASLNLWSGFEERGEDFLATI